MLPLGLIAGGAQLIGGLFSGRKKRPKYQIPGEANQALALAKQQASMTARPGDDQARQEIDRATSGAVQNAQRTASSGSQILGAASSINNQKLMALGRNAAANDAFRYNANSNLQSALDRMAQYRTQQFNVNEMQPYLQGQQTKASLIGAGLQNINNAYQADQDRKMMKEAASLWGNYLR